MHMNIRDWIFTYRMRHRPVRHVAFPRYADVRSILILYESDWQERNPYIRELVQRLLLEDKDVATWGYCAGKKDVTSPILPTSRILGERDINILKAPKQEIINDLLRRPFDLLLDLTQQPCLPLQYLAMYAPCDFKAGRLIRKGIHDFMVDVPPADTPRYLAEQILYYLQSIHSLDR